MEVFNAERREYYIAKKRRLQADAIAREAVRQDALYIHHYGMDAYLQLFPDAVDMGVSWHEAVVKELEQMEREKLAQTLNGVSQAFAATQSKKGNRAFRSLVRALSSKIV